MYLKFRKKSTETPLFCISSAILDLTISCLSVNWNCPNCAALSYDHAIMHEERTKDRERNDILLLRTRH